MHVTRRELCLAGNLLTSKLGVWSVVRDPGGNDIAIRWIDPVSDWLQQQTNTLGMIQLDTSANKRKGYE